MASTAVPTRLPRATSLGITAGITNMTRPKRLTRMTRMNRRPVLGKCVKMVNGKLVGAQAKW